MDFDKAIALKKSLIPKEGFNVVGIDEMAQPDEALYFIGHFKDQDEALAKQKEKHDAGIKTYIYDPNTH